MLATGTIVDGRVETPRFMHTAVHLDGSKERGSTDHGLCRRLFYAELRCTAKTQLAARVVNTACHGTDCRRPLRTRSPASTSSFTRKQLVNSRWQMEPACSHPTSADLGLIKHRWSRKLGFPALRRRRSLVQGIQSQGSQLLSLASLSDSRDQKNDMHHLLCCCTRSYVACRIDADGANKLCWSGCCGKLSGNGPSTAIVRFCLASWDPRSSTAPLTCWNRAIA